MHTEEHSDIHNFVLSEAENVFCIIALSLRTTVKSPLPPSLAVLFVSTDAAFVQC